MADHIARIDDDTTPLLPPDADNSDHYLSHPPNNPSIPLSPQDPDPITCIILSQLFGLTAHIDLFETAVEAHLTNFPKANRLSALFHPSREAKREAEIMTLGERAHRLLGNQATLYNRQRLRMENAWGEEWRLGGGKGKELEILSRIMVLKERIEKAKEKFLDCERDFNVYAEDEGKGKGKARVQ